MTNSDTAASIVEYARRIVAAAPPLVGDRRERIIGLFKAGAAA